MKIDDRKQLILSANQPTNLPQTLIRERSKRSMGGRSSSVVIVSITESDTKTADLKEKDNKSGLEEKSLHVSNYQPRQKVTEEMAVAAAFHATAKQQQVVAFTSNTMDCSSRRDDNGRTSMKDPSDMGSSLRRSVSFARDTKLDGSERQQQPQGLDDEGSSHDCLGSSHNSMGNGSGRVAMMKAKLRESFSRSSSAFNLMDESWGGALEELDMSSSSEESDDDDDDDPLITQPKGRRRQYDDGLDKSAVSLGGSSRRRNTGRGSIFVIADEKFGMTKVVQSRLEKAAKKIQRFLRRSLLKDNKQLKRENKQLAIRDPQQEAETARLEKEVARLEKDAGDWTRISGHYTEGIQQAEVKITDLTEKRKIKRDERKKTEKVIAKILKMLEDHPTLAKENPKLIEKVRKLQQRRREKDEETQSKDSSGRARANQRKERTDRTQISRRRTSQEATQGTTQIEKAKRRSAGP
ncbi:unknown protein [Seminavis robusta]|uniref:Uncharacterized protein n=1 Tax=Seminavis robusta TaxID=568900 RepID=A0A9N8HTX8_9STRA|nr:unknown protein [Seminavis robusta]|eukprot:Sro1958_g307880.1 n/a (466) ;mRNA; f:12136-13886